MVNAFKTKPEFDRVLDELVEKGRYPSRSEAIRDSVIRRAKAFKIEVPA
jgi:Arc/MetJ-type ribon-helix-helix transcriptional regulator